MLLANSNILIRETCHKQFSLKNNFVKIKNNNVITNVIKSDRDRYMNVLC